jgi:hypothetical protein
LSIIPALDAIFSQKLICLMVAQAISQDVGVMLLILSKHGVSVSPGFFPLKNKKSFVQQWLIA